MSNIGAVLASYGADTAPTTPHQGWRAIKCPFHEDRHASAAVNGSTNKFHCFVCGIHEDAIGLVMERDRCDFQTAKRAVEEITGEGAGPVRGTSDYGGWFPERTRNHNRNGEKVGDWRSQLADTFA